MRKKENELGPSIFKEWNKNTFRFSEYILFTLDEDLLYTVKKWMDGYKMGQLIWFSGLLDFRLVTQF